MAAINAGFVSLAGKGRSWQLPMQVLAAARQVLAAAKAGLGS